MKTGLPDCFVQIYPSLVELFLFSSFFFISLTEVDIQVQSYFINPLSEFNYYDLELVFLFYFDKSLLIDRVREMLCGAYTCSKTGLTLDVQYCCFVILLFLTFLIRLYLLVFFI
jgi:hypothetical protein